MPYCRLLLLSNIRSMVLGEILVAPVKSLLSVTPSSGGIIELKPNLDLPQLVFL